MTRIPLFCKEQDLAGCCVAKTDKDKNSLAGGFFSDRANWYHASDDSVLRFIGKTSVDISKASEDKILDDLAEIVEHDFNAQEYSVYSAILHGTHAFVQRLGVLYNPYQSLPEEGDYVGLMGHLYTIGHAGKLKWRGKCLERTFDIDGFIKDLARLTGAIATNLDTLASASKNQDINHMVSRMPASERERFLSECARVFGEKV
jgi:hypothetical protein